VSIPHLVEDHAITGDVSEKPKATLVKAAIVRMQGIIIVVGHRVAPVRRDTDKHVIMI
jgi:hypothetical protein